MSYNLGDTWGSILDLSFIVLQTKWNYIVMLISSLSNKRKVWLYGINNRGEPLI